VRTHPFIEAEKLGGRNVTRTCELLEVSRAAFYARRNGVPSQRRSTDTTLVAEIRQIHEISGGTYGSPRVHAELADRGRGVGRRRVTRLMRAHGVVGIHKRRWRTTTVPDPDTERVRRYFPAMTEFQAGITWQYARVVAATLQLTRRVTAALGSTPSG